MRPLVFIAGCLLGGAASALASSQEPGPPVPGDAAIASQLADKAAALTARERSLAARSADLAAEEERIRSEIARSEALRDELTALVEALDARQEDQVRAQVKVFEKMRGAQAAAVLERTEEETALALLDGMRADKAARILGEMNPKIAARLTEKLSEHPLSGTTQP